MFSRLRSFFRNLAPRSRRNTVADHDADLDAEVRSYADLLADEKMHAGVAPDQARRAACVELGGGIGHATLTVRESIRESRRGAWLDSLLQDVRYAARLLRKSPGFMVAAVMTMAVGIGANTCVFSVIESTLFFPLPYPQSDSIVSAGSNKDFTFESWHEHSRTFSAISAETEDQVTLVGVGVADRLRVAKVTSSFFDVLGIKPILGRAFLPSETGHWVPRNAPHVVILTYALWRDRFGSDPNVVGETIHLDDDLSTIIGVMSKDFEFPNRSGHPPDLLLPLNLTGNLVLGPKEKVLSFSGATVSVFGRLRPESTMLEAQTELRTISQERMAGFGKAVSLVSLRDYLIGKEGSTLACSPFSAHEDI